MLTAADTLSLNPLIHWGLQNSDIFFIVRALFLEIYLLFGYPLVQYKDGHPL